MARRKASPTTPEGRLIASRIQDARRRGATNREIGDAFGMNERTVRKIVAGETPGTRVYRRKIAPPKKAGTSPNIMRLDMDLGDGMVRTVNIKAPNVRNRSGNLVAPTPFDAFRLPAIADVAEAEGRAMQRRYAGTMGADYFTQEPRFVGLRRVEHRRAPRLITIKGTASR